MCPVKSEERASPFSMPAAGVYCQPSHAAVTARDFRGSGLAQYMFCDTEYFATRRRMFRTRCDFRNGSFTTDAFSTRAD
ncbi:MAG: hypothetical protein WAK33_12865, partial [Silvibacterium sp.]